MSNQLYSSRIEKTVLSTLMSYEDAYQKIEGSLTADMFYESAHAEIFKIIQGLANNGRAYDLVMVTSQIEALGRQSVTGGMNYPSTIFGEVSGDINSIESYVERIADYAERRKIAECFDFGRKQIANLESLSCDVWSATAEQVNKAMQAGAKENHSFIGNSLGAFIDELQNRAKGDRVAPMQTGLFDLDAKLSVKKGEMLVIAARPSMGKTTLAQNILLNITKNQDGVTVFFSLEMPKDSIIKRLVSSEAGVSMNKLFNDNEMLVEDEWAAIMRNIEGIQALNMIIDDRAGLTAGQMRATLNKIRQEHGKISAIMVDYLQLMRSPENASNREREISEISMALKGFAKEFDCPMIALAQLNRGLENRPNKRPVLSDLRDSGSIEQDADQVVFIYRDEVYNENSDRRGVADLIIAKQRNGETCTVSVNFEGQYSRFTNFVTGYQDVPMHDYEYS